MDHHQEQSRCKQVYKAEPCNIDTEKNQEKTPQESAQYSRYCRYQGRMQILPTVSRKPGSRLPFLHFFVLPADKNDK